MTTELTLQFREKLDCGKCDDVLLWLHDPTRLLKNVGVTDITKLDPFIEASIEDFICVNSSNYQYVFTYDETKLSDPNDALEECDIRRVCCAGCLVNYVNAKLANLSVSTLQDDTPTPGSFTYTDEDGNETEITYLSPLVDNGDDTYTHTDEKGVVTTINVAHALSTPGSGILRLTTPNGTESEVDICSLIQNECNLQDVHLDLNNTVFTLPTQNLHLQLTDGSFKDISLAGLGGGGSFACSPDFDTWLQCLESIKDGTGCTYDFDLLSGRISSFPLTITRLDTVTGDVAINVTGIDLNDLVTNFNAGGFSQGTAVANGSLFRIVGAPNAINRIEITDGVDTDFISGALLANSCSTVDPQWERFCSCINRCVQYEIFPDGFDIVLQNTEGIESRVNICALIDSWPLDACSYFTGA